MPIEYDLPLDTTKPVKRRKAKAPKAPEPTKSLSLEDHIKALQDLGFTVSLPSSREEVALQQESLAKLGFTQAPAAKAPVTQLEETLYCTHYVGGASYGPGRLVLPLSESALFQSLVRQDRQAVQALSNTDEYGRPLGNTFHLIRPGRSADRKNLFSKVSVTKELYDSGMTLNDPILTAKMDVAGIQQGPIGNAQSF